MEDAITEAISWGLLCSINKNEPQILSIQPVLPYFLNSKLKEIDEETREALKKGFKNYYRNLSYLYAKLIISENPLEKQWGKNYIKWEYENIYQSLQISLEEQESIFSFLVCLRDYLILTNNQQKKLRLLEEIHERYCDFIFVKDNKAYLEEKFLVSSMLGDHYISNKNYQQAKLIFQENLNLILRNQTIEPQTNQGHSLLASTYAELGRAIQGLKQFQLARYYYNKSLKLFEDINNKDYLSIIYNQLGLIAQDLREYKEAKKLYEKSLELTKPESHYFQAGLFHNLGWVNEELGEFDLAIENYQKAIEIYDEYHNHYEQGDTCHQLGNTFYKLGKYDKAKKFHQKALDILIQHKERYYLTSIYNNLGVVADKLSEFEKAKTYYLQALELYVEFEEKQNSSVTIKNLASLYKNTQDNSLIAEVATIFDITEVEVKELFEQWKIDNG